VNLMGMSFQRALTAVGLVLAAASAHAQASAPAAIPFRSANDGVGPAPGQWLLAVLACAMVLGVAIVLLRRFGTRLKVMPSTGKRVRVIERTGVANGVQLVVVEYESRRLLLSVSPTGATCLRDDPALPAGDKAAEASA